MELKYLFEVVLFEGLLHDAAAINNIFVSSKQILEVWGNGLNLNTFLLDNILKIEKKRRHKIVE